MLPPANDMFNLYGHFTFNFVNFQPSNHERIPSVTTTQHIEDLVQNSYIDMAEPSSSTNSNNNNDSINPKNGWTTMTAQVQKEFEFYYELETFEWILANF